MSMSRKKPPDKEIQLKEHITEVTKTVTRPDKSLSYKENKYFFTRSCIKMKLNTFLKEKGFKKYIENLVRTFNRIEYCTYHFLNIYFLHCLEKKKPIPEKLSSTFLRKICTLSIKKKDDWNSVSEKDECYEAFELYKKTMISSKFKVPTSQFHGLMLNQVVSRIGDAVKTHINVNFLSRFQRYMKIVHKETDLCKLKYISNHVFGKEIDPEHPCKFDTDQVAQDLITKYRKEFGNPEEEIDLTTRLDIFIPFYHKMLRKFEEVEAKTFSLFPLKQTYIPNHLPFNTSTFLELYLIYQRDRYHAKKNVLETRREKATNKKMKKKISQKLKHLKKPMNGKTLMENKFAIWDKCFDYKRGETKSHWFDYSFTSNGYDVSIIYKIPKKWLNVSYQDWEMKMTLEEKLEWCDNFFEQNVKLKNTIDEESKEKKDSKKAGNEIVSLYESQIYDLQTVINDWKDWDRLLGIDPGGRALFTSHNLVSDEILSCSNKEYRHLTGFSRREKEINRKKDKLCLVNNLQMYSFKVSETDKYLKSLKAYSEKFDLLEAEYSRIFYRKWRFRCYQQKIETFNLLKDRLTDGGKRTVIGFGNGCAGKRSKIRGCNMPVKGFRNHLRACPEVLLLVIKEGYTTKMCFVCKKGINGKDVKEWRSKEDEKGCLKNYICAIYGLRRCKNNECRITWNRDICASKNMSHLTHCFLEGLERPSYLKKQPEEPVRSDNSCQEGDLTHCSKSGGLSASSSCRKSKVGLHMRSVLGTSQKLEKPKGLTFKCSFQKIESVSM